MSQPAPATAKAPTPAALPTAPQAAKQALLALSTKIQTQLALTGRAFGTVDKLYSEAILQDVEDALKTWDTVKEKGKVGEEQILFEDSLRVDKQALRDKVRAFERKYGGHYGTGF